VSAACPATRSATSWGATALADVLRPPEDLSPSEFAAKHRRLKQGTTFRPGLWSNEVFPYLVSVMDAVQEAIRTGKNLVLMKSGQGGGSEAMINALLWLKTHYPGPLLYLISKDELAKEFSRDRFEHANETCEPVAKKSLRGYGSGDSLHQRRYTDGKLTICGGRSILNLQSEPRRIVMIDEVDSLMDECPDGDPLLIAEIRVDAFPGETLIVAFAHPTTDTRGAGKLFYEKSDQRRGHVWCPLCKVERFWLSWDSHVKVEPHEGQTKAEAERDPTAYVYRTPCCGGELTDALRWSAVGRGCEQVSTLAPEVAARKRWIGVHFSQLNMSNKTLSFLAEKWIEGLDDPSARRVWVNKRGGDVYRTKTEGSTAEAWAELRQDYGRGEVPAWASFMTAGVDANKRHLHYALWAWGLRVGEHGRRWLHGALVDWAELARMPPSDTLDPADLAAALDDPLLLSTYARPDGSLLRPRAVYLDSGWQPRAVYEFCRALERAGRFVPVKGGNDDSRSSRPLCRWGKVPPYVVDGAKIDPKTPLGSLNVYAGKEQLFALVGASGRYVDERTGELVTSPRLWLPHDVDERFLKHASSEALVKQGKKSVWIAKGANHLSDCNVYAFTAAMNLSILTRGKTAMESKLEHQRKTSPQGRREAAQAAERSRRQGYKRAAGRRSGGRQGKTRRRY